MSNQLWLENQQVQASSWARARLACPFLILDTETTGLDVTTDEIVQVAVLSSDGRCLLDTLIQPLDPGKLLQRHGNGRCAADIHGIRPSLLTNAPRFPEVYAQLRDLVQHQPLIIYNAHYDRSILRNQCAFHQLPNLTCASLECAMLQFATWYGAWNDVQHRFTWQTLERAVEHFQIEVTAPLHSALGDCQRTLKVIEAMALTLPHERANQRIDEIQKDGRLPPEQVTI